MLQFDHLTLRRGPRILFQDAHFQVHPGQRVGVTGANGTGKSSLFELVLGDLHADAGDLRRPADWVIGHVAQETPADPRPAIEYVLDGDGELRRIEAELARAEHDGDGHRTAELHGLLESIGGYQARSRAGRLLNGLGFRPGDEQRPVRDFSGGWRVRLNLARALMCRSDLLLLDEPTNHLDLDAVIWLEEWLRSYPGTLLLISHDRDFLDAVVTQIAHIEQQRVTLYTGNYSDFEALRSERLAQQQSLFSRQQKEIRHLQSYVDRFRYKASKARQAQSRLKMIERMTRIAPAHVDSPFRFSFFEPDRQPHHLVQLEQAVAGYDAPVLSGIDLLVSAGDRIGLLGVNGAGKSTLVKALADGSTLLDGRRSQGQHTRIGYFAQHQLDQLDPGRSPAEHLRGIEPGITEPELRRYLGGFGFGGERIFEPVAPFSGGEKARLVLALMMRAKPNLLLLDEPTNHLDLEMRQALSRALVDYGGAIVVISHDRHLLRSVCDDLLVVHGGGVERFDRSIDEYAAWLREQEGGENGGNGGARAGDSTDRREQRRLAAEARKRLKPLSDRVGRIERELESLRADLGALDERLADASLYTDAGRAEEITGLLREQAGLRSSIEELEGDWLDASEALERAQSS